MGVTQYTKMIDNNGQEIPVEAGRVERFLSEGWTLVDQPKEEKKSPRKDSKNKITVEAQVTSKVESEEEEDLSEDNWTFSEDDFETAKKED